MRSDTQNSENNVLMFENSPRTPLENSPRIERLYQQLNDREILKLVWSLWLACGMAGYNFRKEVARGHLRDGIFSASASLICNTCISYEFCLRSPFLAAATLSEVHKNPQLSLSVVLALMSAGVLTAQLTDKEPLAWAIVIVASALPNYALTRLSALIDNDRSFKDNLLIGGVGFIIFLPLSLSGWGDTAKLFSAPSIQDMTTHSLDVGAYIAGSATALFGAIGSFITVLFYCQAIKSIPEKVKLLYRAWCKLLKNNIGLSDNTSKALGGFFALITATTLGGLGYYSMTGFYIAVSTALTCTPVSGELCWLANALELSSLCMEIIAAFEQVMAGMVNTSALLSLFSRILEVATFPADAALSVNLSVESGSSDAHSVESGSSDAHTEGGFCGLFCCAAEVDSDNDEKKPLLSVLSIASNPQY